MIQDDGIVLQNKAFFEKDRLIDVFLKHHGRVRFLYSRGAKLNAAYSGILREFTCISVSLQKGKSFYYLRTCQLKTDFSSLFSNYNDLMVAYYFSEAIRLLSVPEQENIGLYLSFESALMALKAKKSSVETIRKEFEKSVLMSEGLFDETHCDRMSFQEILRNYTGKDLKSPQFIS